MIREIERRALSGWLMLPVLLCPVAGGARGRAAAGLERRRARRHPAHRRVRARSLVLSVRLLHGRTRTRRGCCSCSATTSARSRAPGCAGPTRSTPRSGSRCACATSRASAAQGQRPRRQPDRDRGGRGLAGGRHRRGHVRGRRLRALRDRCRARRRVRKLATRYPYDAPRRRRAVAARQHRGRSPSSCSSEMQERLRQGGRRGARGAHQPPGLRAGDRGGDAAAAAGRRDHRRAPEDRRGRRRHGRDGARAAVARADVVQLDEERKAAMVSNLLVVLCSERAAQPIINTGTLYQ